MKVNGISNTIILWVIPVLVIVGVYLLYSFATDSMPVISQSKGYWLKTVPIAHRGLHENNGEVPENSMISFEKAMENGYAIELDVQLSADKKVVVFHDYELKRMTGIDRMVNECTWKELSEMKLMGGAQGIPLFKDVLKLVDGKVPLLVEIKNEGAVGELEKALYEELKGYKGEFAIQSFNPFSVKWFRQNAPEIIRGQLSGSFEGEDLEWYKKVLLKNLLLNFESKPAFIAYEIDALPKGVVSRLAKKDTIILGWTAKPKEDYEKAVKYCDNVIFEGFIPE